MAWLVSLALAALGVASVAASGRDNPSGFVRCETTAGDFTIDMYRAWAPLGHDRFMDLVRDEYFTDQLIYRVIPGFIAQFGCAAKASETNKWPKFKDEPHLDPPVKFAPGVFSFAGSGEDSRSSHVFVGTGERVAGLGGANHERPFGRIKDPKEIEILSTFYDGYGDLTDLQGKLKKHGNYAAQAYPKLTRIKRCYAGQKTLTDSQLAIRAERDRPARERADKKRQAALDKQVAEAEAKAAKKKAAQDKINEGFRLQREREEAEKKAELARIAAQVDAHVRCETTAGDFTVEMHRAWAPLGYDRFMELVDAEYFTDQVVYRVIPDFIAQWGIASDPAKMEWGTIHDDQHYTPPIPFKAGTLSFAAGGRNNRDMHVFIGTGKRVSGLGRGHHERPIGQVTDKAGLKVIKQFYSDYGDLSAELQGALMEDGNAAEELKEYPKLDRVKRCYRGTKTLTNEELAQAKVDLEDAAKAAAAEEAAKEAAEEAERQARIDKKKAKKERMKAKAAARKELEKRTKGPETDAYVRCETTQGPFTIEMHREWAAHGYDRFMDLIEAEFFDDQVIYRVLPDFVAQFGAAADPKLNKKWKKKIKDDFKLSILDFTPGTVSFAGTGTKSRNHHMMIATGQRAIGLGKSRDNEHERPIGRITDEAEQEMVKKFYSGYGDLTTELQKCLRKNGNQCSKLEKYPKLDRIKRCRLMEDEAVETLKKARVFKRLSDDDLLQELKKRGV